MTRGLERRPDLITTTSVFTGYLGSAQTGPFSAPPTVDPVAWLRLESVVPETVIDLVPRVPYSPRATVSVAESALEADTAEHAVAAEMTGAVLQWLSLTVTEIADVLQVERATIYGWREGRCKWPRKPKMAERLGELYQVACRWRTTGNGRPLEELRHLPIGGGESVLSRLREDVKADRRICPDDFDALLTQLAAGRSAALVRAQASLAQARAGGKPGAREAQRRTAQFLRSRSKK